MSVKVQKWLARCFGVNADSDGIQRYSELNMNGQELPDPVPTSVIVPGLAAPTLGEHIQRELLLAELRRQAELGHFDTPAEADDLDIEDDPLDPLTRWEAEYVASQERRKASQKASAGSSLPAGQVMQEQKPISDAAGGSGKEAPAPAVVGSGTSSTQDSVRK